MGKTKVRSLRRKIAKQVKKREEKIAKLEVVRAKKELKDAHDSLAKGKVRREIARRAYVKATKKLELVAASK